MQINGVTIVDAFAEAFPMSGCRAIVTAVDRCWAETAATAAVGYGTSVIGCNAEAGVERLLDPAETPDGRPGVSILMFAFNREALQQAVTSRVGQCVMTCPTTACYNGLVGAAKSISVGSNLRYFGDGFQISKQLAGRRFWRIPVMDGEFVCEDTFGAVTGVAGGNFLIFARDQSAGLEAAKAAVQSMRNVPDVLLPFPGGVVRSGSKVGAKKYRRLKASTNEAYCPTLRGLAESAIPADAQCVYEIVFDGLSLAAVEQATRQGVRAACLPGVVAISAGDFGGNLGRHHIHLHAVLGSQ